MPQLGPLEILLVAAVALIVFGPEKLPELARSVGRTIADLRRMADDMRFDLEDGLIPSGEEVEPGAEVGAADRNVLAKPGEEGEAESAPGGDVGGIARSHDGASGRPATSETQEP